jgi:hypothetical protein
MEHDKLTELIIGFAMKVHRTLGPGVFGIGISESIGTRTSEGGTARRM